MPDTEWWGKWEEPSVLIGVPSTGVWLEPFGRALLNVTSFLQKDGVTFGVHSVVSSLLPKSRNMSVQRAIDEGFTHLLFVDADQTFPATTANQLFSHRLPIVGAVIATKAFPPQRTACLRPKFPNEPQNKARRLQKNRGLEKVWRVGCGVLLIETEVFRRIPEPWFSISYDDTNGLVGEDWYFMQKAEDADIPIFVDHDLSARVTHVGMHHYTLPEYQ